MSEPRYQVMPDLAPDDAADLRASIKERGILVAVEKDDEGNILDGHNRVALAQELGVEHYPIKIHYGLSDEEKRTFAREINLVRRHLTAAQKRGLVEGQLIDTPSLSDRAIAARLGVSHNTVAKRRDVLERRGQIDHVDERTDTLGRSQPARKQRVEYIDNSPDGRANVVKQAKVLRGENQKISHELRMAQHAKIKSVGVAGSGSIEALQKSGPFSVIYADPPWRREIYSDVTGGERGAERHYPTATLEEIISHVPPVTDDALLFLWVTASNAEGWGREVMLAWGFDYVTELIWNKVNQGMGYWQRDCHEKLWICKRGSFPKPVEGTQPRSVYDEKKGRHSDKPDYYRQIIADIYSPGLDASQRIEMYARGEHPDFERWGLEA